jgi:hypothetical protein
MLRINRVPRRVLLGLVVCGLTLGGSLLLPTEALAGVSGSPGSRPESGALIRNACTGEHLPEAKLTVR